MFNVSIVYRNGMFLYTIVGMDGVPTSGTASSVSSIWKSIENQMDSFCIPTSEESPDGGIEDYPCNGDCCRNR